MRRYSGRTMAAGKGTGSVCGNLEHAALGGARSSGPARRCRPSAHRVRRGPRYRLLRPAGWRGRAGARPCLGPERICAFHIRHALELSTLLGCRGRTSRPSQRCRLHRSHRAGGPADPRRPVRSPGRRAVLVAGRGAGRRAPGRRSGRVAAIDGRRPPTRPLDAGVRLGTGSRAAGTILWPPVQNHGRSRR